MATVGELLVRIGLDPSDFKRGMDDLNASIDKSMSNLRDKFKIGGAALLGVGAAGLKLASDARVLNSEIGMTAIGLGVSTGELRKLVIATSDVSFGLKEVASTFDLLTRAGMRDTSQLQKTAKDFDTLGDAIGMEASQVADILIPTMAAYGVALQDAGKYSDVFTYLTRNSLVGLEDFGSTLRYIAPNMEALGLTIEDTAAILLVLASRGIQGANATLLLRKSVSQAVSEHKSLNSVLNITQGELDDYKGKMTAAYGITENYSDAAETQYGVLDHLRSAWNKLTFEVGTFLAPLEPLLGVMTSLGTALVLLSNKNVLAAGKWVIHTAAVVAYRIAAVAATLSTSGLGLAIGGLALVGGIGYGIYRLFDTIKNKANDAIDATVGLKGALDDLSKGSAARATYTKYQTGGGTPLMPLPNLGEITLAPGQNVPVTTTDLTRLTAAQAELARLTSAYQNVKENTAGFGDELKVANDELDRQKTGLAGAQKDLVDIQTAYNDAQADVATFEGKIRDANDELQRLSAPKFEGMGEVQDQLFDIDQQINQTRLAILQMQNQYGADVDTSALDKTLADLERQREIIQLQGDIKFDPLTKAAKDASDAITGMNVEMAPQDVMDRIVELGKSLGVDGELGKGLADAHSKLDTIKIDFEKQNTVVADWKKGVEDAQSEIDILNTKIKAVYDAWDAEVLKQTNLVFALQTQIATTQAALNKLINTPVKVNVEYVLPPAPTAVPPAGLTKMAEGGLIKEPTLLYGLKSRKPYAIAGEAGVEKVTPVDKEEKEKGFGLPSLSTFMPKNMPASLFKLQLGGIVTRPTLAMIGEQAPRVPEVVAPLDKLRDLLGLDVLREILSPLRQVARASAGGNVYNSYDIDVNGPIIREEADIDRIGQAIVDKIRLRQGLKI